MLQSINADTEMTPRIQVTQLVTLVLVTSALGNIEHRVSFTEDYNSQLLPPTEVNS